MTPIMGKSEATAEQMAAYLLSKNPEPKIKMPVLTFCQLFIYLGALEGVRGDLEFARSCKETGHFAFNGTVVPEQNNYCGHGTTSSTNKGSYFPDEATGILVQIQHAKAYATADPLTYECLDSRYKYVKLGSAPNMEDMGGKWAVPGYDTKKYSSLEEANAAHDSYGYQVVEILDKILGKVEEEKVCGNSALVDYVCISPNSTNPRNTAIRKITIHHMAGDHTVEKCAQLFMDPAREASANYGIGTDGRVGMYVEECNRPWTSGSRDNDHQAVTIEVANDVIGGDWHVSDKALAKLILLCADICKRNGIERLNYTGNTSGNLTMHKWFQATTCPGPYLESKFPYIADEVNKLLGSKEADDVLYKVQVGAFGVKANAENLKKELEAKGIDAIIVQMGDLYKVQTGAYRNKVNAENMKQKLEAMGYKPIIVEVK